VRWGVRVAGLLAAAAAVCACSGSPASPEAAPSPSASCVAEPEAGFRSIFDGTTSSLEGWRQAGPGGFDLVDCGLRSRGGLGLLWYAEPLGTSYVVRLEWKMSGDDNSGVFVGFPAPDDDPWRAVNEGYEVQIDASDPQGWTTGAIYGFRAPDRAAVDAALAPAGEWNTYEIAVAGPRITVRLNGAMVNDFTSADPARLRGPGHVGLQNHSDAAAVTFRNISIRARPGPARPGPAPAPAPAE
jgi:hypothetical protein